MPKPPCIVCGGLGFRRHLCQGCYFFERRHGYLPGDPAAVEAMQESRMSRWEKAATVLRGQG